MKRLILCDKAPPPYSLPSPLSTSPFSSHLIPSLLLSPPPFLLPSPSSPLPLPSPPSSPFLPPFLFSPSNFPSFRALTFSWRHDLRAWFTAPFTREVYFLVYFAYFLVFTYLFYTKGSRSRRKISNNIIGKKSPLNDDLIKEGWEEWFKKRSIQSIYFFSFYYLLC